MSESQIFDLIVLVLIVWLTLRGLMRGMVAQLLSVAAIFLSWVLATKFSPALAPMVPAEPPWNKIVAMLAIFVGTSIVVWFLRGIITGILASFKLKRFDNFLGAVLGLTKGVLLCMILMFFAVTLTERTKTIVLNSSSGKYLAFGILKCETLVPDDVCVLLHKNLEGFRESVEEEKGDDFFKNNDPFKDAFQKITDEKSIKQELDKVKDFFANVIPLSEIEPAKSPIAVPAQEKIGRDAAVPPITVSGESRNRNPAPLGPAVPFQPGLNERPPVIP